MFESELKLNDEKDVDLSIICPCLKIGDRLLLLLQSIESLAPEGLRYEILLVTPDAQHQSITQRFASVRIVAESKPAGIYAAMNLGVFEARGKYVYFTGDDDIVLTGFWAMLDIAIEADTDVIIGGVYWGNIGVYYPTHSRLLLWFRNWCHQGIIYRIDVLRMHPYNVLYKLQADHELNLRVMHDLNLKKMFSDDTVASWYSGSGVSTKGRGDIVFWNDMPRLAGSICSIVEATLVRIVHSLAGGKKGLPVS